VTMQEAIQRLRDMGVSCGTRTECSGKVIYWMEGIYCHQRDIIGAIGLNEILGNGRSGTARKAPSTL